MINFIVVNNGLKNYNGHYYETGISVCEAASSLGYNVCMGAHFNFDKTYQPTKNILIKNLFEVDHWHTQTSEKPLRGGIKIKPENYLRRKLRTFFRFLKNPRLFIELRKHKFFEEIILMEIFLKNLTSLLEPYMEKEGVVFLPTAHPRELFACSLYNYLYRKIHKFSFAFEFRHPLTIISTDSNYEFWVQYKLLSEIWFKFISKRFPSNFKIYTDTPELVKEYEAYLPVTINTLPIPFRSSFFGNHLYSSGKKLSLGYFGDARDEKGFQHLPGLHKFLKSRKDMEGNFKFLIQCTNANLWANGIEVLNYFKTISPEEVELVGIGKPLADNEYYHLISSSDVCLLPYDSGIYRSRSSGCLSEAIAMGIPSVIPKNTWLEKQAPENCQVSFQTIDDFYNATYHLIKNYSYYHENIKAYKKQWLDINNPKNLVIKLFEEASYGYQ